MSRMPSSVFSRAKSGYRSRYSSNLVRRGILNLLGNADVRDGARGCDRSARIRSESPRAASRPPPRTRPSAASAGAAAAARRLRACRRAETGRSRQSPLARAGRTRRRTLAAPPSSYAAAAPIAPAPSPDTTWRRSARGRKTLGAEGHRPSRSRLSSRALIFDDPVAHRLVEVTHQDLLVVERELAECLLLEPHLRAVERAAVLQAVLLERERGVLVRQTLSGGSGGHEVEIALEHVRVVRRRPVPIRDVPAALVDEDLQVREDLEVVDPPARDARRVDARQRVAEVRRVPRPRAATARERLGGIEMLGWPGVLVGAAGSHHAVRPVD